MKKIVRSFLILALMCACSSFSLANASENLSESITKNMNIQNHISDIGLKILNANKIDSRVVFLYSANHKKLDIEPELLKRQVVVYDNLINFAKNDDEIAAILARGICRTAESYSGMAKGRVSSMQVKLAPKKYEIFFDKRAVDFMVQAGYNPIGLITVMNKAFPQKRSDKISRSNLTSKRLANIYEYIYFKYPYFIKNNEYINTDAYQNFLLTSQTNRKKLEEKIKSGSKKAISYE
ncbi:hypothetical protein IJ182_02010 [bacterium]|nr:hypothetical protein [bacterium]